VDGAFVTPLASTVCWFPNFAYKVTSRFVMAVIQMLVLPLLEFVKNGIKRVVSGEEYQSVPSLKN